MISYTILCFILISHWVSDFVCQTDYMARNKSKSNKALFIHCFVYTLGFIPFAFIYLPSITNVFLFLIINLFLHMSIDYITSRITSKLSSQGKYGSDTIPNFGMFSIIGLDQMLHYISLFGTYLFFSGMFL